MLLNQSINKFLLLICAIFFFLACGDQKHNRKLNNQVAITQPQAIEMDSIQTEIDEIYSLLAYSIVLKYWAEDDRNGRGYNVGSVLVDPSNKVVDWGLNHVNEAENCTQHGEVRLMTNYLNKKGIYSLNEYNIYSTLEPCAMCAGMMTMASVQKTINGQRDFYFTAALERLAFDSEDQGGYPPYPRTVISQDTPSKYRQMLNDSYNEYIKEGNKAIITKFLSTNTAKDIYAMAFESFKNFKVIHPLNLKIHNQALTFYNDLPNEPK